MSLLRCPHAHQVQCASIPERSPTAAELPAAAVFAGLAPSDLQQVLLTEYAPGAGIGWHKDKPMFAEVVGLSLLSRCVFRLRAKQARLGSGAPSYSSHARPTCFKVLPEPTGSTASRPWTAC